MGVSTKIDDFMTQGSWIRKMFEEGISLKAKYGSENVFDLSLGNPVMQPPSEFFDTLKSIAKNPSDGMHRYMPNAGLDNTRSAVAEQLSFETNVGFTKESILMTCGAGGALNVIMKTLLDPGDEVVIFAPYFVEYNFYADNHGASCCVVPPDDNFLPDMAAFKESINSKTRLVLINSPNNPTGVLYPAETLREISDIISEREKELGTEIFLVSDEPYRKLLFDNQEYPHVFQFTKRSIVATSHSKDLALPGERIGFIAVHPDYEESDQLMNGMVFSNRILGFVNAPSLMQWVVKELLDVSVDIGWYERKRDYLYRELTDMGYDLLKPAGAFYAFPKSPIPDDVAFVQELLKWNVLVTPGTGFGSPGFFRISFCLEDRVIEGAMEGFREAIKLHPI